MTIGLAVIVVLVVIVSAFIKGWSGFGTNLIAIPVLLMLDYDPQAAVVIIITLNLFINSAMLIENKKFNIQSLSNIKILVIFGIVFTLIGILFLKSFDKNIILVFMGIVIVLTVINKAFNLKFKITRKEKYYIPVGTLSGLFNGIAGLGGLPVLILLSNSDMKKEEFKTTLVSYFLVMNIVAIIGYFAYGMYTPFIFTNIVIILVFGLLAAMFGVYMSRRVSDELFQKGFIYVLAFMGIGLVFKAFYVKDGTIMDSIYYLAVSFGGTALLGLSLFIKSKLKNETELK